MKKFSIFALGLILSLSLAACSRRNNMTKPTTPITTTPATEMTILPDPTLGTNIPDPSVDTSMPMYTDGTENTTETDNFTNGTTSGRRR